MTSTADDPRQHWCKHFTGVQHHACKAGHHYNAMGRPLPCVRPDLHDSGQWGACPDFSLYSMDEYTALEAESAATVVAFLTKLSENICPFCDAPVQGHAQVGRCVYAQPCNHRLYQGKATLPRLHAAKRAQHPTQHPLEEV